MELCLQPEQAEKPWQTGGTKESNVSNQSSEMRRFGTSLFGKEMFNIQGNIDAPCVNSSSALRA
eukprot:1140290-Pelagomonas_calceolata.AAC.1